MPVSSTITCRLLEIDLANASEIDLFGESEGTPHVQHAVSSNDRCLAFRAVLELEPGSYGPAMCEISRTDASPSSQMPLACSRALTLEHISCGQPTPSSLIARTVPSPIVRVALRDEWCPSRLLRLRGAILAAPAPATHNTPTRAIRDTDRSFIAMVLSPTIVALFGSHGSLPCFHSLPW